MFASIKLIFDAVPLQILRAILSGLLNGNTTTFQEQFFVLIEDWIKRNGIVSIENVVDRAKCKLIAQNIDNHVLYAGGNSFHDSKVLPGWFLPNVLNGKELIEYSFVAFL